MTLTGAGYYSFVAMVTSAVIYLVAFAAFSAEWASARNLDDGNPVTDLTRSETDRLRVDKFGRIGVALATIGLLTHLAGVVLRGIAAQRAPWGNMYEFVTTAMLFVAIGALVLLTAKGMRWLGLPVTLLLTVGQGLAVTVFYVDVAPLVPALHSVWFVVHIVAASISGALFNLGAIASILFLIRGRAERRGTLHGYLARIPSAQALDRFAYRAHAFAFPLWTFTIAAGSIWAEFAWGRYWGWDPKETWSLITWVVYAAYLHARSTAGWRGRPAAILAIIGVITFWFNFVGINLLVSGLHSYAGI
ncbi:c-type cytochrome biogenesis protein CcsB [Nigerium massiliense]|uniref:c-type cytochrome biogenesis protein CcsB n=1 Tax=Nigerium massiliense TaxID=1522317 RepID=UPI0005903231|nr:c-type cytochrome biogenesis protein CcsB [Nigerium massiliense]